MAIAVSWTVMNWEHQSASQFLIGSCANRISIAHAGLVTQFRSGQSTNIHYRPVSL